MCRRQLRRSHHPPSWEVGGGTRAACGAMVVGVATAQGMGPGERVAGTGGPRRTSFGRSGAVVLAALLRLTGCSMTPSHFAQIADTVGSAFAAAATTLDYAHHKKITPAYAAASFVRFQDEVQGVAGQLPSLQGASRQARAHHGPLSRFIERQEIPYSTGRRRQAHPDCGSIAACRPALGGHHAPTLGPASKRRAGGALDRQHRTQSTGGRAGRPDRLPTDDAGGRPDAHPDDVGADAHASGSDPQPDPGGRISGRQTRGSRRRSLAGAAT
jgi:hypothetical protein